MLETLGTSQAAEVTPGLRRQIESALAAAIQDERSRQVVWLYDDGEIKENGTLDQHMMQALLRVAGFGAG